MWKCQHCYVHQLHKYGTLYFSLRLLELMTELEMIGVLSQLVFNEHNGLALL